LRPPTIENLKVVAGESAHGPPVGIDGYHIHLDEIHAAAERRPLLRRRTLDERDHGNENVQKMSHGPTGKAILLGPWAFCLTSAFGH
jgi:hypothetical protein